MHYEKPSQNSQRDTKLTFAGQRSSNNYHKKQNVALPLRMMRGLLGTDAALSVRV